MNLRNEFSKSTKALFIFQKTCMRCGSGKDGLQGDHIFGRMSNSPLNFSPLCPTCHFNKAQHGIAGKIEQLNWTVRYLYRQGYKWTDKDREFLGEVKFL